MEKRRSSGSGARRNKWEKEAASSLDEWLEAESVVRKYCTEILNAMEDGMEPEEASESIFPPKFFSERRTPHESWCAD